MIKRIFIATLMALALTRGVHGKVPEPPKPREGKFAVQLFRVESPRAFDKENFPRTSASIERLFNAEGNVTKAYPTIYAELGKAAVNDQTKSSMLPSDYNIVNGEPVAIETLRHIGVRAEVTIHEYRNGSVRFSLKFHHQEIKGQDEYTLRGGKTVSIPVLETRKVDTELSQTLGSWVVVGGIESATKEGKTTAYYIIRVTKPNGLRPTG